ncbi:hypothetical protein [Acidisoma cladoniae]|uniref:hypothetical protein n=1 Tax=Acidisoma cladoniae TaxID=3040935 RepID=UPI00254FA95B|nr:hypothetical protein [Acidisoma sp. PAMC 29798]
MIPAEGLEVETFLDSGNRGAFANGGDAVQLHPVFQPSHGKTMDIGLIWYALGYAPLRVVGSEVDRARASVSVLSARVGRRRETAR